MHKIDPPLPQRKKSIKVIYESQSVVLLDSYISIHRPGV
jgi:hypothetical protein